MRKQMEGDNEQRRQRAKDARDEGRSPSAEGVTTGASKQRDHRQSGDSHDEKTASLHQGKRERSSPDPRPGSTEL